MSHTFKIGEIAILQNATNPAENGMEVEVVAQPRPTNWFFPVTSMLIPANYYVIKANVGLDGTPYWGCRPDQLRKRRPPQDWMKLCNLTDIPREVTHV